MTISDIRKAYHHAYFHFFDYKDGFSITRTPFLHTKVKRFEVRAVDERTYVHIYI